MSSFPVKNIPTGSYFTKASYIDDKFIITAPEMPFTEELKRSLSDWNFREILSSGENLGEYASRGAGENKGVETAGIPGYDGGDRLKQAENFYLSLRQYAESVFTETAAQGTLEFNAVAEKMKNVCDTIVKNSRLLLMVIENLPPLFAPLSEIRPQDERETDGLNYLADHTAAATIISIILGSFLKLRGSQLIELGTAALVHEIGMIKVSPRIYLSKHSLSSGEQKIILGHPLQGYAILNSCGFPRSVSLACLEHHERENGEGYPKKLTGDKISQYAKIIAVACSYEAMTHVRPYKDAKDGHTGILDLLKNERKQYDTAVIRALVYSLSIYPIGIYVLLSNNKKGQVVDVNPGNPKFPIVQLLDEFNPDGTYKTVETAPGGLSIMRSLMPEETGGTNNKARRN
ncbi:MAG: HD-GYP domain-containing protein [Treponema sp.]|nr:HD-GYP domain-containing protein [Treponema sp.]